MPANTGFGILSVGKDCVIDVVLPTGQILNIDKVTSFDAKQDTNPIASKGMDGINRNAVVPHGWSGSIKIDRGSHALDDYFAKYESDYYAGKTITNVIINATIQEGDGTITSWQFRGCAIDYSNAGMWQADKFIDQAITFKASQRIKVK